MDLSLRAQIAAVGAADQLMAERAELNSHPATMPEAITLLECEMESATQIRDAMKGHLDSGYRYYLEAMEGVEDQALRDTMRRRHDAYMRPFYKAADSQERRITTLRRMIVASKAIKPPEQDIEA